MGAPNWSIGISLYFVTCHPLGDDQNQITSCRLIVRVVRERHTQTKGQGDKGTDRLMDRHIERQIDRQTEGQTVWQIEKQTYLDTDRDTKTERICSVSSP